VASSRRGRERQRQRQQRPAQQRAASSRHSCRRRSCRRSAVAAHRYSDVAVGSGSAAASSEQLATVTSASACQSLRRGRLKTRARWLDDKKWHASTACSTKYGRIYVICCQDDMRRSVPHSEAHDATAAARYPMQYCIMLLCRSKTSSWRPLLKSRWAPARVAAGRAWCLRSLPPGSTGFSAACGPTAF
jgi:hypothetical protein